MPHFTYGPGWRTWRNMTSRCTDPKNPGWKIYGARGIKVCERWMEFENFVADMGPRPTPKHSIGRIDNDGPYSPENCRWETSKEQNRNTRNIRLLTFNEQTKPVISWAEDLGMSYEVLCQRLHRGWSIEEALSRQIISKIPTKTY